MAASTTFLCALLILFIFTSSDAISASVRTYCNRHARSGSKVANSEKCPPSLPPKRRKLQQSQVLIR
ncbi:unnamed protein product [Amaranthus hypochondriacus]